MQTRVYVPVSASQLRRLGNEGRLAPVPIVAYAVTTDLRRTHPGADEEELEYLALLDAVSQARGGVIVAADANPEAVEEAVEEALAGDSPVSSVRLSEPVERRQVASFHVPGETGPSGGPELSWYDATELAVVLDLLGASGG